MRSYCVSSSCCLFIILIILLSCSLFDNLENCVIIFIGVICLKMYVTIYVPSTIRGQKTGIRTGVTDDYLLPCGYLVLNTGPLPEHQVLLTTDNSTALLGVFLKHFFLKKGRTEGKENFIELTNISGSLAPKKLFYFTSTFKTNLLPVSCLIINFSCPQSWLASNSIPSMSGRRK